MNQFSMRGMVVFFRDLCSNFNSANFLPPTLLFCLDTKTKQKGQDEQLSISNEPIFNAWNGVNMMITGALLPRRGNIFVKTRCKNV